MARAKVLGKSILLLILIIILVLFGLLWFDYLGIIQAKKIFAPVYRLAGLQPQTSTAPSSPVDLAEADLDNDRFAKRLEALDIRSEELDKRENDVATAENNNTQVAQELEDQKKAQEEREKPFNHQVKKYDDYKRISEHINEIYDNYNDDKEPHETTFMNKIMTNMSIEMKTLTDKSDSKIAELLLQGTNMGIIEGRKFLNHSDLDKRIISLINKYIDIQEEYVEQIKEYL